MTAKWVSVFDRPQVQKMESTNSGPQWHICVSESGQRCFRRLFGAKGSKLILSIEHLITNYFWKFFYHNTKLFIHENASEYIVCERATILPGRDELTLISTWTDNHMPSKVGNEMKKIHSSTSRVAPLGNRKFHPPFFNWCNYLSMLGLNHYILGLRNNLKDLFSLTINAG